MKIIYHCYGGAHSSVIAAALHLKLIEKHRLPFRTELMALPYFDKTCNDDFGSIRFMGIDDSGNEVYVLGKKSMGKRYSHILRGTAEILGAQKEIIEVDCFNKINIMMKIGGFLSRRLGLIFPGRPILIRGSRGTFMNLVNLVETVRVKSMNKCR